MSETPDQSEIEWPREIWLAELDKHHNGTGMVVLSEFATVPRWEGDDERDCEFQRYIDGDIHDIAERYWKHQIESRDNTIAALEAQLAEAKEALSVLLSNVESSEDVANEVWIEVHHKDLDRAYSALAKLEG